MATSYPSDGFFTKGHKYRCAKTHTNYLDDTFVKDEYYFYESTGYERWDSLYLIRFFPESFPGDFEKAIILFISDIGDKEQIEKYFDLG